MTCEELAARLNGREYREEMTRDDEMDAQRAGLVVAFSASDDSMEFRGAICVEFDVYDGGSTSINSVEVTAEWCPDDLDASWRITTTIPHATFDIMEGGQLYCRGIVFRLEDTR